MIGTALAAKAVAAGLVAVTVINPAGDGGHAPRGSSAAVAQAAAAKPVEPVVSPYSIAAVNTPTGAYAFIRGADNHLFYRALSGTAGWVDTGIASAVSSGPSAASGVGQEPPPAGQPVPANYVDLVAVGRGAVGGWTYNTTDGYDAWHDWQTFSGQWTSPLSVTLEKGNQATELVFGRGTDGALWANNPYGNGNLGGKLTSAPMASYSAVYKKIVVTVRGSDGYLYRIVNRVDNDPASFGDWVRLSTAKVNSAGSLPERSLRYYYRGTDGALWFINGAVAGGPATRIGGGLTSPPVALDEGVAGEPDRARIFARGTNGKLYMYSTAAKTWTDLGGTVT